MSQPVILLVTEDERFANALLRRWQNEPGVPEFLVTAAKPHANTPWQLAILALADDGALRRALADLDTLRPVLCLLRTPEAPAGLCRLHPGVTFLPSHVDAVANVEYVFLLASEMLRRNCLPASGSESDRESLRRQALGEYMLEVRHRLNNALTSVLGNAELLMLHPEALPENVREQVQAIHTNAVRMHEVMHRLTMLDTELKYAGDPEAVPLRKPARAS